MYNISKVRQAWVNYPLQYDWNIFGTLNFAVGKKPSHQEAQRITAAFFNKTDHLCFGNAHGNQRRFPRYVCTHRGSNGDNPHNHFLAFTQHDPKEFSILLNAIWSGMNGKTAVASENEILPVFSEFAASEYLLHEDRSYQIESWNETLSHLSEERGFYRNDTLPRLYSVAGRTNPQNDKTYLSDAEDAFEPNLLAASQRFIRRNPK
jgi:hypothetical protein